ncbi:MAG: hypothetical protein ACYTBS_21065, partial [Planctomycetota bacterium]
MLFGKRTVPKSTWMGRGMDVSLTDVEKVAVRASAFEAFYPPTEKMPAIIVENFPSLGRLAAMRFIEWVQGNPGGVVS